MNELTELEKAYIAGFFDGEGCVSILKYQGTNNRTPSYKLHVVMAQNDGKVLSMFQAKTGIGGIYKKGCNHREWSDTFEWRISTKQANDFLEAIYPYLIVKKDQVEIAIEFQNKMGRKNHKGPGYTVPKNLIMEREAYYLKLQKIKGTSGKMTRGRVRL